MMQAMQTWRTKPRPSWRAGWWVWLMLGGLLLALAAFTIQATRASDDRLGRLADQAQLVGVALTLAGAAITVTLRLQQRLQPATPPDAALVLSERVWQVEQRARWALLGDTTAAAVSFAIPIPRRGHHRELAADQPLLDRLLGMVRYRPEQPGAPSPSTTQVCPPSGS
jgi:hypothetical protein